MMTEPQKRLVRSLADQSAMALGLALTAEKHGLKAREERGMAFAFRRSARQVASHFKLLNKLNQNKQNN